MTTEELNKRAEYLIRQNAKLEAQIKKIKTEIAKTKAIKQGRETPLLGGGGGGGGEKNIIN